jgi:multidrug efflux pump subunit AcrB
VFGAVLTIFVVYAFLNSWRSTLITALSLPTSVLAAFIAVWLCGFTLNFMTLLGLSLAIGVLIDDAIVVRENIVRHMENGSDRRTAALEGTAEIGMAVASTTFSIMAVFIPVAFMPGISGEWFRPFALTVACSVIVSLFISFTLDPMLSAYWGDPPGHHHAPKKGIEKYLARFNIWFDHQADRYGRVIAWALHHRRWMAIIAVLSLVARAGPARQVRRYVVPAEAGQRPAADRSAHAGVVVGGLCPHEDGRSGRAGAQHAGDQGHERVDQLGRRPHLRRHRQAPRAQAQRLRDRRRAA